jgi:hypothetical protein
MVQGKKRVEHIPQQWADAVRQRVDHGRQFKETLAELFGSERRTPAPRAETATA